MFNFWVPPGSGDFQGHPLASSEVESYSGVSLLRAICDPLTGKTGVVVSAVNLTGLDTASGA